MTLLEKCKTLNNRLSELEHARQQQSLADALNKRASELDDVQSPFVSVMSSTNVLCECGIINDSRLPDSSKASERVAAMRQQLVDQPQDITKGQAFNLLCRAIKKLTEQCETIGAESWKEHIKQTAPLVQKNLLDQFRESPNHADTVFQMERLLGELRVLVRKPPSSSDTLNEITAKWDEVRDHLNELPISDDPEIQAFLTAATSSDGAELGLLTTSVIEWLEEKNMLTDFRIRRSK